MSSLSSTICAICYSIIIYISAVPLPTRVISHDGSDIEIVFNCCNKNVGLTAYINKINRLHHFDSRSNNTVVERSGKINDLRMPARVVFCAGSKCFAFVDYYEDNSSIQNGEPAVTIYDYQGHVRHAFEIGSLFPVDMLNNIYKSGSGTIHWHENTLYDVATKSLIIASKRFQDGSSRYYIKIDIDKCSVSSSTYQEYIECALNNDNNNGNFGVLFDILIDDKIPLSNSLCNKLLMFRHSNPVVMTRLMCYLKQNGVAVPELMSLCYIELAMQCFFKKWSGSSFCDKDIDLRLRDSDFVVLIDNQQMLSLFALQFAILSEYGNSAFMLCKQVSQRRNRFIYAFLSPSSCPDRQAFGLDLIRSIKINEDGIVNHVLPLLSSDRTTSDRRSLSIITCKALGAMGKIAKGAIPKLREVVKKADFGSELAISAINAIRVIESDLP